MKKCKICKKETEIVFNIGFKAVPICENCAKTIFIQQANWYAQQKQNLTIQHTTNRNCATCLYCQTNPSNKFIFDKYKCTLNDHHINIVNPTSYVCNNWSEKTS